VRIPRLVLILISLAALIYISERLWQLFRLFADLARMLALAGLLAYILHPVVAWMDRGLFPEAWLERLIQRGAPPALRRLARLRIPYALGATLIYTGLLGLLLLALLLGLPLLIRQALDLAALLPQRLQHLPEEMVRVQRELAMRLNIPPEALALLPSREAWQDLARQGAGWLFPVLVETARQVGGGVVEFLLILALSYYTMLDWRNISQQVLSLIPRHYHDEIHTTARILDRTFGGFLRGQLLIALLNGLVTLLVMLAFEAPFAGLIALLSALIILIPIIGAPIALWGPRPHALASGRVDGRALDVADPARLPAGPFSLPGPPDAGGSHRPAAPAHPDRRPDRSASVRVLGVRLRHPHRRGRLQPGLPAAATPREDAIRARERSAGSPSTDPIEDRK
jgi:predicted PurR-regulated permease PerM